MELATPHYTKWNSATPSSPAARSAGEPVIVHPGQVLARGSGNHGAGIPSTWMEETYAETFTIPNAVDENGKAVPVHLNVSYRVEDWGIVRLDGIPIINLSHSKEGSDEPTYGGHSAWSGGYHEPIAPGTHTLEFYYNNIHMDNADGNMSICEYSFDATVLESGGVAEPEPCPCNGDTCSPEGGQDDEPSSGGASSSRSRSGSSIGESSSAGSSVTCSVTEQRMLWSCNAGNLRGFGTSLGGKVQLCAESFGPHLATPAALAYDHPMQTRMDVPAGGAVPGSAVEIHKGNRIIKLRYYQDGHLSPVGVDTLGGGYASIKKIPTLGSRTRSSAEENEGSGDGSTTPGENEPEAIKWQDTTGAAWEFDKQTGERLRYIGPEGVSVAGNVNSLLQTRCSADGALRQIWSYWDGLLNIEDISATGYRIALYTANLVTGQGEDGLYTLAAGAEPFKSFTFGYSEEGLRITENTAGLEPYTCLWSQGADGAWSMVQGSGSEAISTTQVRSVVEPVSADNPYEVWQLVKTVSKGGVAASCTCDVYQSTFMGNLLLTHVEGYGSDAEQTTTYAYDGSGNAIEQVSPNGHKITREYDSTGRLIRSIEPWADGQYRQITDYEYAYSDADRYSAELSEVKRKLNRDADNSKAAISAVYYTRTEEDGIRREVRESTAPSYPGTQVEITETWAGDAPVPLNRGRLRMTQAANGVQTWYSYEHTTLHGALYSITKETKEDGQFVRSHSTRSIAYINAAGNTVRAEEWVLLYNGEWAKISGENYLCDVQNRRIGTVKDNGRSSSRTLTCRNQPLREVDENGIQTDYAYDSARQLIEVTRAAVLDADGETVITPETITEYTRDATGKALCTKVHTGAMLTQSSATYDLSGRIRTETDTLGRTTTYVYGADGLSSLIAKPNRGTYIASCYTDGKLESEIGTEKENLEYRYDVVGGCERTRTYLRGGQVLVSEQQVDGLGQELISARAVPGGFRYTRNSYNAKGQLVRSQQDCGLAEDGTPLNPMAPIICSYGSFGNPVRETLVLDESENAEEPGVTNSRLSIYTYSKLQEADGGIYSMVTTTHNNALGGAYTNSEATLISALSPTVESKSILTDERGKQTTQWVEYGGGAIRLQKQQVPTSTIIATTRMVDGFAVEHTDSVGTTTGRSRSYGSSGIFFTVVDGRGNTTTLQADTAGRITSETDAAGNTTTTAYCADSDLPATITNAQGKTTCYRYDARGRKLAEWGTAIQPSLFAYDDADRLTTLTTFRAEEGDISTDPQERTDGDTTTWAYDPASGLELSKTYADGSTVTKTYDSFGRLATETNARGVTKTFSYHSTTGELSAIVYSDGSTPAQAFTYTLTGKPAGVTDAAGTRSYTYNEFDELVSESLTADGVTHAITESRDAFGRSSGYAYAKGGESACAEQYGYAADGRLSSAAFSHGGEWKTFGYSYLAGSNLLQTLSMPNGMTLTQQYEEKRDLLTAMLYKRGETGVAERYYSYDSLGRPVTRQENRNGGSRSDAFTHNDRSELTAATLGNKSYTYAYDNIGNRKTAQEDAEETTNYAANALNQYTAIGDFAPQFDADGNQTRVQTSTGIWNVTYNAENRPIVFTRTNDDGTTTKVSCAYDHMGRRATKKVETISADNNSTTTLHQRYLYRNYLQIACCDLTRANHPHLWFLAWDPTQPTATRPLALRKDGTWYCYGWDLTKNICEVFSNDGRINNTVTYSYTPYGAVTAEGTVQQAIQWSSEFYDDELGLVYYNYRHYNPKNGKWIRRDELKEKYEYNLYRFAVNAVANVVDYKGLNELVISGGCNTAAEGMEISTIYFDPFLQARFWAGAKKMGNDNVFHDRNWSNFISSAEAEIKRRKEKLKPGECIEWAVEKPTYRARAVNDRNSADHYINIIRQKASALDVKLRFYDSKQSLAAIVNSVEVKEASVTVTPNGVELGPSRTVHMRRSGNDKLSRLTYFGHGKPGALLLRYDARQHGLPELGYSITNEDIESGIFDKESFAKGFVAISCACNSATPPDDNSQSLRDVWKGHFGSEMHAVSGRTDYAEPQRVVPSSKPYRAGLPSTWHPYDPFE